jgi:type II secretory pathway pseudopilin PulG
MRRRPGGITLLELVIVIVVLAILAGVGMSRAGRMAERSRLVSTAATYRSFESNFVMYFADFRAFPPNAAYGLVPPAMTGYIDTRVFTRTTPIGGRWDWNGAGSLAPPEFNIGIFNSTRPLAIWTELDRLMDDGSLATGRLIESSYVGHLVLRLD